MTPFEVRERADGDVRARMKELEQRCELFFGTNIKSVRATWTPASACDITVELEKWDGTIRCVPERELVRVFEAAS